MTVSIVIPAYNCHSWLRDTVASVRAQSHADWQMVIVDDGSKDDTLSLATELATEDERIQVVAQKNQGVTVARNFGISFSKGEHIAFLDADDIWEPEFLSRGLAALQQADVYVAKARRFRHKPGDLDEIHFPSEHFWGNLPASFLLGNWIVPAMVLMRRSVVEELGGFEGGGPEFWEDWDFWAKAAARGKRFAADREVMVHYRVADASRSSALDLGAKRSMGVIQRYRGAFGIKGRIFARHGLAGWHLYLAALHPERSRAEAWKAILLAPWRPAALRKLISG